MKVRIPYLLVFTLLLAVGCGSPVKRSHSPDVTAEDLKEHLRYLASDELKGRAAGTKENEQAAEYIAARFQEFGVRPGGPGAYFQRFPFVAGSTPGTKNSMSIRVAGRDLKLSLDSNFRPLSFSSDTSITTPLVFAGYGISDTSLKYDDYAGIDIKDKIVVVLRNTPKGNDPHSPFAEHAPLRAKAFSAREHGAAGIILVSGPLDTEQPELIPFSFDQGSSNSGIPVVTITWPIFDSVLHSFGKDLRSIQSEINTNQAPGSFVIDATVSLETQITKIMASSTNVVGVLEGNDPDLKSEYILLGAHFDHLGMGGKGSLAPDTVAVHHGADDNASGTAGLLEAAEFLSSHRDGLKRSVILVAFSAEEIGLIGSAYFVKNPLFPIERIKTMVNMDMIGRLRDSALVIEGVGTSPSFEPLLKRLNADSTFKLTLKPDGYGPSDHASFYSKDMPVLFFFTNLHSDYHKPSDTWDKINYEGEAKVVNYVTKVVLELDRTPEAPVFVRVASSAPQGERREIRVTLGVIPDYADDGSGLKISGTRPGSPAEKGGLLAGDVIVKFADKTVKNVYDFTYILQDQKPGNVVDIEVKRGDKNLTFTVTLEAR